MSELSALRRDMLKTAFLSQEGHLPSSFSVLEILWSLYAYKDHDDRVVLSKGHAALALYAVLADRNLLPAAWWHRFCQDGSFYEGHPNHNCPQVEFSTGSLGHGMPMAAGLALGLRIQNRPGRVFCLIGDEEANEGSVWETALLAHQLRLNNFVVVVDDNRSSPLGMLDIAKKFKAFGWQTHDVDGHDLSSLKLALGETSNSLPICIVARTVKGHGCKPLENKAWHRRAPTVEEIGLLMADVV